jgi:stage II sporulation protein GA (sporulation sigma-E factor processing peptidase)
MKIYIEFIFIINYLLDFMILFGTKRILKINSSNIRIILSSFIGMFTTIFIYISINKLLLFYIKIIISCLLILVSFGKNNFIRNISYFYLVSIIIGGVIYLFDLDKCNYTYYFILVIGSFIIIRLLIMEVNNYKENITNKYLVTIVYRRKKYNLEGFIDTGCRLKSLISNKDIILVNLDLDYNEVEFVPYKALNYQGIIPCIRVDKVIINKEEFTDCLIGLCHDKFSLNGLSCILPNTFRKRLYEIN